MILQPTESVENSNAVLGDAADGIVTITLNRPQAYNTLTSAVIADLSDTLNAIADDPQARVVIIASTGKAFCTGHDMKEMATQRDEAFYHRLLADCSAVMQRIVALPQPVIARVQGIATAAGCQLVATCNLAVAATSARFATNGIRNGLYCATPSVALSRVVARKHALETLLTGDFIDAERAAEIGLVNRVVNDAALVDETRRLAAHIADNSLVALRRAKASFYRQVNQPLDAAYRRTCDDLVRNLMAADGGEGLNAFIEKREPAWRDE